MAKTYKAAAIAYAALLLGFTGYLMLDTFVLSSAKQTGAAEMNLSLFTDETKPAAEQSAAETETAVISSAEKTSAPASGTAGSTAAASESSAAGTQKAIPIGTAKPSAAASASANATASENAAQSTAKSTTASTASSETDPPETDPPEPEIEFISNETAYQDENISITLSQYTENETMIYVADVVLSSAQYLKTAFANDTYGKNVTAKTSEIAAANNAILAVNGDFYGTHNSGYVIRNGVLYRDIPRADTDFLCIMADGSFFLTTSDEYSAQELLDMGAWQCFMFGPRLIENGAVTVDDNSEVARAMASNPRTAIGIVDDLHYLFVVSDGRTSDSDGLSLSELASFMQGLGAQTAYNLDGGGSSTMVFNGSLINNPTTSGRSIKERSVSDIVYIGY